MLNTEVTINPTTPKIISDTIDFDIKIKTQEIIIKKCNSMTYQLSISNETDRQIIDTFSVQESNFLRHVKQKIDRNKSFKYLEIKSSCDKKDLATDFIVVAKIE